MNSNSPYPNNSKITPKTGTGTSASASSTTVFGTELFHSPAPKVRQPFTPSTIGTLEGENTPIGPTGSITPLQRRRAGGIGTTPTPTRTRTANKSQTHTPIQSQSHLSLPLPTLNQVELEQCHTILFEQNEIISQAYRKISDLEAIFSELQYSITIKRTRR